MPGDVEVREDNVKAAAEGIADAVRKSLEEMGLAGEGFAKAKCPVDTGNLRNSITHATDDTSAYIGTNVEYAPYVELGTVRTRAQPYLRPAATEHSSTYRSILERNLKNG